MPQTDSLNLAQIATSWLVSLENALAKGSSRDVCDLFIKDCHWRDILVLGDDMIVPHGVV